MRESAQVLVIGGGPAGATVAGLLAREGFTVVLAERERFRAITAAGALS